MNICALQCALQFNYQDSKRFLCLFLGSPLSPCNQCCLCLSMKIFIIKEPLVLGISQCLRKIDGFHIITSKELAVLTEVYLTGSQIFEDCGYASELVLRVENHTMVLYGNWLFDFFAVQGYIYLKTALRTFSYRFPFLMTARTDLDQCWVAIYL